METITMSRKEINQVAIFEQLKDKKIRQRDGAKMLELSLRQVKRKLKAYRKKGAASLVHGARGKPSHNQIDQALKARALALIEKEYRDFQPTFASEKLFELHGITINPETLRLAMAKIGLWTIGKRKTTHRSWRERRACFGELVLLDGSPHAWFEERAPKCTLLAFIDDATGKVLRLLFAYEEATIPTMEATKAYFEEYGIPTELYVDRGKVFKVNQNNPDGEKLTQYGRAISELDCKMIFARSPEAKGRIERLFGTLQDRLVKELRLAGISTMDEANRFLNEQYIEIFNAKFAVAPRESQDLHRPTTGYDLNAILAHKEERTLTSDFTIRYENRWFQLTEKQPTILFPKDRVTVAIRLDGSTHLTIRKVTLVFNEIEKPLPKPLAKTIVVREYPSHKPAANHPWRQYKLTQKVTF